MKQFIDKLIERLKTNSVFGMYGNDYMESVFLHHAIAIVNQLAEEHKDDIQTIDVSELLGEQGNDGWIPVEQRLPEDCDNRFYMCIVENHEEDLPMFCQYDENHGFGFWHDYYDEHTLGFVDSEFKTNEELGYEKVIAWQPLPAPYQPKGE